MKVIVTLDRLDKDHELLERRQFLSRSFVNKFIQGLYLAHAQIQTGAPYSVIDISNTARNVDSQGTTIYNWSKHNLVVCAPAGQAEMLFSPGAAAGNAALYQGSIIESQYIGIQVGTGVNAVTPADYALQTRVAHGRGAGQLELAGCELINLAFAGANGTFDIRRYFTNLSGGGITINECGIYALLTYYTDRTGWAFCFIRDLVVPAVTVNNTELLRVTYTPTITV